MPARLGGEAELFGFVLAHDERARGAVGEVRGGRRRDRPVRLDEGWLELGHALGGRVACSQVGEVRVSSKVRIRVGKLESGLSPRMPSSSVLPLTATISSSKMPSACALVRVGVRVRVSG